VLKQEQEEACPQGGRVCRREGGREEGREGGKRGYQFVDTTLRLRLDSIVAHILQ